MLGNNIVNWAETLSPVANDLLADVQAEFDMYCSQSRTVSRTGKNNLVYKAEFVPDGMDGERELYSLSLKDRGRDSTVLPAICELLGESVIGLSNPEKALHVEFNVYPNIGDGTGWHKDGPRKIGTPVEVICVDGEGELNVGLPSLRSISRTVQAGERILFHNEQTRRLHRVSNIGEISRKSIALYCIG